MMPKSLTTTNPDWFHNNHVGELLVLEFLDPLGIDADSLARAIDVVPAEIRATIAGRNPMDAAIELRRPPISECRRAFSLAFKPNMNFSKPSAPSMARSTR